ncbi:hypothetical protein [Thermosipho sp. (in: thermotogales)]|uniref:hypothetical protein n=1 Tax=Thermosipho sp. (in: thermotogales) TaxID=1968895 RepID=UPI0025801C01|nr:hypothetical protein [Thermosipho sp. (in: thermotogales)]MBZ4649713.1 hypothetical protein [Thermosipho sp. (in: thermotogales)]
MPNLLSRRLVGFDIIGSKVYQAVGEYFFGKIKIKELREYNGDFEFEVDDLIIVNIPWDLILNLNLQMPMIKKRKDIENYIVLEVSQNFNLESSEFSFDFLKTSNGLEVFVVRKADLNEYFHKLESMKIPEPDIVCPDFFKESLLLSKFPGYNIEFFINSEYSGLIILNGSSIESVRYSELSLKYLNDLCNDEFGYNLYEVEDLDDEALKEDVSRFLYNFLGDMFSLIEREIFVSLNSSQKQLTIEDIQSGFVYTDSELVNKLIFEHYTDSEIFNKIFTARNFKYPVIKPKYLGSLGLITRGGFEFGKFKFIQR